LDITPQPKKSLSSKLDLEWIQEYIKCNIKLSFMLVLNLNAVQPTSRWMSRPHYCVNI
jgi:hypothetical protein